MRARWFPIVVICAGCSVESLDAKSFDAPKNACGTDAQCGDGVCDQTLGVCKSVAGAFSKIVFEVTPPSNAKSWSNLGFILPTDVATEGGPLDLALGSVAKITGTVTQKECAAAADNEYTAPVKVIFTSTMRRLGLSSQEYSATAVFTDGKFEFSLSLPPDEYDVYIKPDSEQLAASPCPVVPQIRRGVVLDGDQALDIALQVPQPLHVDVTWPSDQVSKDSPKPLTGWLVEVVDPITGRNLSEATELSYAKVDGDPDQHYEATVLYTKAGDGPAEAGKEIVRIHPPKGKIGPTVAIERAVAELLEPNQVKIDAFKKLPVQVTLDSLGLYDSDDNLLHISASVRFVSTKLEGVTTAGTFAFYETTVQASDGVAHQIALMPGDYDVLVAPEAGTGFARTIATLTIPTPKAAESGTIGGKALTVDTVSKLGGSVFTPSTGKPVLGASVQASASPRRLTPPEIAVAAVPFAPQATAGQVTQSGKFLLEADPGTFDFSVRPVEGTRFAWLVRPKVQVKSGQHDLGPMTLPLPVVYQGSVLVPDSDPSAPPLPVPGSVIRAFVFLDESGYTADRAGAKSVLQIAETRAGDDGAFELYLPSHLD